ncbi:MAG: DUF5317 domain-containing protein [Tepidanaerobacteraceae bacterium]|jgi:hypothetical protein|nr:DUF5317 domain-containing protein [Thermoanaerobacterales bacterium]
MLVDFLVISFIVGLLRGGNIKQLTEAPFKHIELIFLSFIVRYLPLILPGSLIDYAIRYNWLVVTLSYAILLYFLISNLHIKAVSMVAIGVFLNLLVIIVNGGKMPVSLWAVEVTNLEDLRELLYDPNYLYHTVLDSSTKFKFLADIIPIPPPYPKPRVFSIGDFLMGTGLFLVIQKYMLPSKKARNI